MNRYLDAETFEHFKKNQETLIDVLNHNMTDLTRDVSNLRKDFKEMGADVKAIAVHLGEMRGSSKVIKQVVFWILGIVAVVVGAAVLANIS